jgi:Bacteriophage tail sheath protein
MPVSPTYPGVYVEEIPSGVHTITGVATAICALVGIAPQGPVNEPTEVFSFGEFEKQFGGLTLDANGDPYTLAYAVRDFFLNGGGDAIVVRVAGAAAAAGATTIGGVLTLTAQSSGTWGNTLQAQVDGATRDRANKNLFNLSVQQVVNGNVVRSERFVNLSTNPADATYVVPYLLSNSSLVAASVAKGKQLAIPPAAPAAAAAPAAPAPGGPAAAPAPPPTDGFGGPSPLKGGTDVAAGPGDVLGDPDKKTGIFALQKVDLFNILCLPAIAPIADATALSALVGAAAQYCQSRRAVLLIDPPDSWSAWDDDPPKTLGTILNDVTTLHGAAGSAASNAAVYFPRVRKANPLRKFQIETFAPSGTVAGVYARTDANRGVWKAPAGLEALLNGVSQLAAAITDAENGKLNQDGVNCLRTFPLIGSVVWGARTLDGADIMESDYKYVPVRRFALFLEESLFRGTKWVVFEPNDEPLWSQIRLNVGAFMHDLFRQGAFQGKTPKDAYFVKCDSETTTQTDINKGIVNIIVGFAPLKPAEFVILQIQQMAGQIAT